MQASEEVSRGLLVAGGDGAEALEVVEEDLDQEALSIQLPDHGSLRGRSGFELMTGFIPGVATSDRGPATRRRRSR